MWSVWQMCRPLSAESHLTPMLRRYECVHYCSRTPVPPRYKLGMAGVTRRCPVLCWPGRRPAYPCTAAGFL